ncbi:hypothetical protein LRP52_21860 [Photobacterium sp. ZSDE20]|uniref:Uncharacterized protein n=1 Tax=Photobacterium pectinilyticum TaxID=2906793 RepID=A0ABT1N645_9GAMM|nr:hypothetical protein [Photobacterium sp. ZSDE20]MCQ1059186.1 hypothetical protein [Photobacterium sp. ZSDE20]MDD1824838.1 hypothetical protein [Photobacterium sp. ZSDE20]
MRKTHIALLVAVVSSPLALANDYQQPYNPYYPSYDDGNDKTITDSYNDDIDKTLTLDVDKEYSVDHKYYSDDDTLKMKNVNNTYKKEWTDNSLNDYSTEIDIKELHTYHVAKSELHGYVTYSEVEYGGGDCCGGKGGYGYGPSQASTLTVNHTNDMSGAFVGASGINIAGQNAGNNSLVQQSASTNAVLAGN